MFHLEILGARVTILLHDLPDARALEANIVRMGQHATSDSPQIYTLSRCRLSLLPAGVLRKLQIIGSQKGRNQVIRNPFLVGDIHTTARIELTGESSNERHERLKPVMAFRTGIVGSHEVCCNTKATGKSFTALSLIHI